MENILNLSSNEVAFKVIPINVKYECEHCRQGEMIFDGSGSGSPPLHYHTCSECKGKLQLPKIYPYIKWVPTDEEVARG